MSDLAELERDLLTSIASAQDEAALETVRVKALGKKGSVSELLKTLGSMTPDERREKGPLINSLRERAQTALNERKRALADAALDGRLAAERLDLTLPMREAGIARGACIRSARWWTS